MTVVPANRISELKRKIESREARIGIVGMGYVGLPLALLFSGERFRVTGLRYCRRTRLRRLTRAGSYIVRILPQRDSGSAEGGLSRHDGLLRDRRDGCGDHLCAYAA